MPRTSTRNPLRVALLVLLPLGLLGCGGSGGSFALPGGGGTGSTPTTHPTNAQAGACLNAEEPPINPPDSATYNYGCHDARMFGVDPVFLTNFVAFYTRLAPGDQVSDPRRNGMHPNSGPFADVVVNIPGLGRLEFGRRTSFRPVWVSTSGARFPIPLLVARTGDGTAERPDRINRYSWARILRNTANEVVVHWRYVPDPCNPTQTGTVHELFTIRPDGTSTRLVHCSADTLEQAAATTHNSMQTLTLTTTGATVGATTATTRSLPGGGPPPSATSAHPIANPTLDFRLDDGGASRTAAESVSGNSAAVGGRFPNWVPGVSGSALSFDGYTTEIGYPSAQAPAPTGSFTLEAWVQLAAYPWGTVQIAGQASPNGNHAYSPDTVEGGIGTYTMVDPITGLPISNNPVTVGGLGYLLSIDALGQVNIMGNFGGTWSAATGPRIPLHEWHHIAGVYDAGDNELRVYLDGQEVGDTATTGALNAAARDFVIGRNREPAWPVAGSEMRDVAFARSIFGHEGLIDEVRMYNRALTGAEVLSAATRPGAGTAPTLAQRTLPTFAGNTFSCAQQTVSYHRAWDQLFHDSGFDDVVVTYDLLPTSVFFWKGKSGAPAWICQDGIWTHDQSMEWGDDHGLCEHMSDKQQRYAHVRVLEDTPARKVIHWRYAMVGVTYRLFAGAGEQSFIDEYFTMYPDGTTIRFVDDWWCSVEGGVPTGFQGTYFTTGPGQRWTEVINDVAAVVLNGAGTRGDLDVVNATAAGNLLADAVVIWTNTRSNYRMFRGLPEGSVITYYDTVTNAWTPQFSVPGDTGSSRTPWSYGNHFPCAQVPNDGRSAFFPDRISHSEGVCDVATEATGAKVILHGFTQTPEAALPWVNGWNDAPDALNASLTSGGFNRRSYAYEFTGPGSVLTFDLDVGTPIRSPGIVVRNWTGSATPTVTVGGNPVATARTGIHFNGGVRTLVVWLPGDHSNAAIDIQ